MLAETNSFSDVIQATGPSREASSSAVAESAVEAPSSPNGVVSWTLGGEEGKNPVGWRQNHRSVVAKSDNHPEVVADLIAEYFTDTILRIDVDASVDLEVSIKQDLILVLGEVGCSHPAKTAIIHSDQFFSTLNSSLRDLLRDLCFFSSSASPPPSSIPVTPVSPKRSAASPSSPTDSDQPIGETNDSNDFSIDATQAHIILAITPPSSEHLTGESVRAVASAARDHSIMLYAARNIQLAVSKCNIPGCVVVELFFNESPPIVTFIDVAISVAALPDSLVKELTKTVLNKASLLQLTPHVTDSTLVQVRLAHTKRLSGRSSSYTGKDWNKPQRYAHVLAKLEADRLLESNACTECDVQITVCPSVPLARNDLKILAVSVHASGTTTETSETLSRLVFDRCTRTSVQEVKDSITSDVFSIREQGGSVCSH